MSNAIRNLMKFKGYKVFDRPYELNIVGVRSNSTVPNKFDDKIIVFFKDDLGKWNDFVYNATTDTGTYWLNNPLSNEGSALLKDGQYIDSHKIGLHKGQYTALVQSKPLVVIRDYNRDAVLDFNNGKEETGLFGINIHRANSNGTTINVDKYSAGCQVFANATDFSNFIDMAQRHSKLYGNNFTYTLVDDRAIKRTLLRRGVISIVTFAVIIGVTIFAIKKFKK